MSFLKISLKTFTLFKYSLWNQMTKQQKRLIFDMSELNQSINLRKFTMTKLSDIIPHIFENKFAASLDISKAYFHVPINPKYKKVFFL